MGYAFVRATGDYLSYEHLTALDEDQTFSLSLWVYPTGTATPNYDALVNLRSTSETHGWVLQRYATATRQIRAAVYPTTLASSHLSPSTALTLNAWQHLFLAADLSRTDTTCFRCWINGTEISWNNTFTGPRTVGLNTAPLLIGSSKGDGTGATFEGSLAEVALWTETITTESEIDALAAGRVPPNIHPTNLIFYAPLRSDTVDVVGSRTGSVSGATVTDHPSVDAYGTERLVRRPGFVNTPRLSVARRTV